MKADLKISSTVHEACLGREECFLNPRFPLPLDFAESFPFSLRSFRASRSLLRSSFPAAPCVKILTPSQILVFLSDVRFLPR